ncbi:MAG: SUMF1/EgtB/PvdO family nonheme iron enzyme [Kiloniellales bacterium]|nr:SUMF1/EgtB/PvdO family nonheme iron enzyme [Kiloniellales bacterium]
MASSHTDQPIRILHFSDIHFREEKSWDADAVLRALTRFIKKEVEDEGLAPDLVAITGDLAYSGSSKEYALAREWLEDQLWPALADVLPRDLLLLVPGNHDVDRSKVSRGVRSMQDGLLRARSQDEIAELLSDKDDRRNMLRRHAGYMKFVADWYGKRQPLPWWQRTIELRGTRLHFAGLDSAWMSCGDKDRGSLLLGRYQLTQSVMSEEAEGADWRIALMHHPWDYLAEFDHRAARSSVHQHCDLLLRGHLHEPLSERVVRPDPSRSCLELAAGCVYEDSEYPNAFQWIELSPTDKRVRVLFRAWLHSEWTADRNQPGCPEGHADFKLGARRSGRGARRSGSPEIPSDYLAWLATRCVSVELLGQDVQQSHALTLSHVYVPALTQPEAPAVAPEETARQPGEEVEERQPTPLLQRIDERSLYIPAPAGSGKSTFCRWAALQSIPGAAASHPVPAPEEYREPVPMELRARLPLLVPLRDFAEDMDCGRRRRTWRRGDLERALAIWIDRSPPPGLSGELAKDHLAAGTAFLLLDGVDEVAVSEAREGVTVHPRALLLSGLSDALPAWEEAGNRILLTSRPYGLKDADLARLGLARAPLEPLPESLQHLFVTRWFHTLGRPELGESLLEAMYGREDLSPLTENPMLLTAICVLYDKGGRLPEDRYELYKSIVDGVLHSRYPGDAREREPILRRLEAIAYGMHTGAPGQETRETPAAEISWIEMERLIAHFAEVNPAFESGEVEAAVRREELLTRSGLLLPRPNERAGFYHLSFQEFLAAQRIVRTSDDLEQVFLERGPVAEWRPTLLFLFAAQIFNRDPEWGLKLLKRLIERQDRGTVHANPATAAFIAEALELCLAKGYRVPEILAESYRRLSLDAIEDEIEVQARQALGLCLGRLGDPRIFDLRDSRAYVEVPAGTYPYGEEGETVEIGEPFRIGRYPVTNGQYLAFVEDGGYRDRQWWSKAGWDRQQRQGVTEPRLWRDRRWNGPNQPVVGVSFWEAEACCAWAGGHLPREEKWEAAARGPEGCEYPWCGRWEDGICNTWEARLHVTSVVGLFPRSRQAQLDLDDLAGNVLEWCSTAYSGRDHAEDDGDPTPPRVLRGGSWSLVQGFARCALRDRLNPSGRFNFIGFRVLCSSPILDR